MRFLEPALPNCSADEFDGEIVAINLETGIYYSVKDSAALVWQDLAERHSVESLLDLASEDAKARAAIERFVDELLDSGLMRPAADAPAPAAPARLSASLPTIPAPVLEPFGDMKDLLLLDPVHDVEEEAGWPKARD